MNGPRLCPPRYATPRTPSRKTLGGAAAKVAEKLGLNLMPWQRLVLDTALEVEDGMLVYREVIVTVPRQSGKTSSLLALILTRALARPDQRILYTAQTRSDGRRKWFEDWIPVLQKSEFADHFKTRLANGDEALVFNNGSRQGLIASTLKSGHGAVLDLGIIDEAFAYHDARLEQALKPAMITRSQPPHSGAQLWIVSTAGTVVMSPYLWGKVESGREIAAAGVNKSVAYFEWSADEDCDPADQEVWWDCMPALGRTASVEAIQADFMSMDLHEFMRAYLNMWTTISLDPVIPIKDWMELAEPSLITTGIAPITLSLDVAPDRQSAAVAASGRLVDGSMFVEVVEHRKGTAWVVPLVEKLVEKNNVNAVILDKIGPAGSLLAALEDVHVDVECVTAQQLGQSCGLLFDAVVEHKLVHLGQPTVTAALDGGAKRPIGDGGWAWGRKNSGVDISPLVAITLAHWGGVTLGPVGSVGAWDLNEIVDKLRKQKNDEAVAANEEPPYVTPEERVALNPGGVTFVPL